MNGVAGSGGLNSSDQCLVFRPRVKSNKFVCSSIVCERVRRHPCFDRYLFWRQKEVSSSDGQIWHIFKVRKNVIFECTYFNRRRQGENESIEQFTTSLYHLAKSCEYGELKEEMIRDRVVMEIENQGLSEHLQLGPALTPRKPKLWLDTEKPYTSSGQSWLAAVASLHHHQ